jgi:hypothetical protein
MDNLKNKEMQSHYKEEVKRKLNQEDLGPKGPKEKWKKIVEICTTAAKDALGKIKYKKQSGNSQIMEMSKKQKKIRNDRGIKKQEEKKRIEDRKKKDPGTDTERTTKRRDGKDK